MAYVYPALLGLLSIASLVIFIKVLIRSFKDGGILHGILGLLTCGMYTFVWGWIKGKQLQLTKTMMVWTLCWIGSFIIPVVAGTSALLQVIPMSGELSLQAQKTKEIRLPDRLKKQAKKNAVGNAQKVRKSLQAPSKDGDWNTQAVALWREGKYADPQKAAGLLVKALQADPRMAEAYNNRGNAYREMKKYGEALQDYNQAIRIDPQFVIAYNNRGNVYYDQQNYQMAVRDYNKAISLDSAYHRAYLNRGLAYHQLKRDDLACQDFTRACQLGDCEGIEWARQQGICQ